VRRLIVAAVLAVALILPAAVSADLSPPQSEAVLVANVAINQRYVDNLFAALARPRLTVTRRAQLEASLARHLDKLARMQRALAAYRDDPILPDVLAEPIGAEPLPNNALLPDTTYGCPAAFDPDAFEARYGFSIQVAFDKVVTGILRPDLSRWQRLVGGGGFDQRMANYYKTGDVTKQRAAIAYFAGTIPFSQIAGYFGGWYRFLGCGVDIGAIHDLGAN